MEVVFLYMSEIFQDIPSSELKTHNIPEDIERIIIKSNRIKTK